MKSKKYAKVGNRCVACGNCLKQCKLKAITIYKGINALIDVEKCVGCMKCLNACPVNIIEMVNRSEDYEE